MKWHADYKDPEGRTFIIMPEKCYGGGNEYTFFIVYAFDKTMFNTHDHHQDDLEMAKRCALHEFGVPMDCWKQVEQPETWIINYKHPQGLLFIIQKDLQAGFYTRMYKNPVSYKRDLYSGVNSCTNHDGEDVQDTLQFAKERANEMYGVPVDSWKQVG